MSISAVIGLGLGDEGKGRTVDYLCSQVPNPLVIRYSGGSQAGHRVVCNDRSHVFSNFGSGTFRAAPTYWMKNCPIDPIGLINEYNVLIKKGVTPKLFLNPESPIITPYDIKYNLERERINKHGTCGIGIFTTLQREKNNYHLLAEDLCHPTIISIKLKMIREYYGFDITASPYSWDIDDFFAACESVRNNDHIIVTNNSNEIYLGIDNIVYEGSQGLLLDQDIGFFPFVTPSSTGTKNIAEIKPEVYLVTRAYQTRHGNGPMSPIVPNSIKDNPEEQNNSSGIQGEFRKTLLDLDLIRYAVAKDDYIRKHPLSTTLVITCMDLVESEHRLFDNGKIIQCSGQNDFVSKIEEAAKANEVMLSFSQNGPLYRW